MKQYYVYFMANKNNKVLYVGVTNDIERRVFEHKNSINQRSFTSKYNCYKLVYFEPHQNIVEAIEREKNIKNWHREWKNQLIKTQNPDWIDLAAEWEFK